MKIKCTKCNVEKGITVKRLVKLRADNKVDTYLCRGCRKANKPVKPVVEKKIPAIAKKVTKK